MKRPLVIILIVAGAVLLVGAGIYLRARTTKKPAVVATPVVPGGLPTGVGAFPVGTTPGTTGSGNGGNALSVGQSQAVNYLIRPDGTMIYVKFDGQIIIVSSASSSIVSTRKFPTLLDASFAADGRKVLIKSGDGSAPRWSVYDVQKNSWRELPIDARDVRWAPQGYQVAYFSRRLVNQTLTTLDLQGDTLRPHNLLTFNGEDLDLAWAGPSRIIFGERASAYVAGSLWSFDTTKSTLRSFLSGAPGATVAWGRGNQGLVFTAHANEAGGTLTLMGNGTSAGTDTTSAQTFSFLTLPQKCTFFTAPASSSTPAEEDLVCAIPRDSRVMAQAALPDDYQKSSLVTEDDLYRITLGSGEFTPVMNDPSQNVDAIDLEVMNGRVYFLNRVDRRIYSIALPQ